MSLSGIEMKMSGRKPDPLSAISTKANVYVVGPGDISTITGTCSSSSVTFQLDFSIKQRSKVTGDAGAVGSGHPLCFMQGLARLLTGCVTFPCFSSPDLLGRQFEGMYIVLSHSLMCLVSPDHLS